MAQVRKFSAFGMLLLALTTTFAAFDWVMSLDPHWYSNIFGVYFWSGSILGSLAAVTLLALGARRFGGLSDVITVEHLHDLGKLLFGFTVFWAYIAFSQYFLIWYAAIPEETTWYALRMQGEWRLVSALLLLCHFVVPFVALLPRATKRSPLVLGLVALWLSGFSRPRPVLASHAHTASPKRGPPLVGPCLLAVRGGPHLRHDCAGREDEALDSTGRSGFGCLDRL